MCAVPVRWAAREDRSALAETIKEIDRGTEESEGGGGGVCFPGEGRSCNSLDLVHAKGANLVWVVT